MAGLITRTFWTIDGKNDKDGHPIEFPTEAAAQSQSGAWPIVGGGKTPVKVHESMTEDGEYVQTVDGPDGQPQEIARGVDKSRLDLAKERRAAATEAAKPDPSAPKPMSEYERAQIANQAATATRADRTENRAAATASATATRADRTENRTITSAEAAAKLAAIQEERRSNIAERGMTVTEANAKAKARYDELDNDLKQAENQRAIQAAKLAEDKARLEREKFQADQVSAREKETTRQRENQRDFAYTAGRDAVGDAKALMPYRVGPGYNDAFAGVLNSMGGPQISGRALDVQMPDFSQIARQAADQAYAMHSAPVAAPGAVPTAVPPGLATLPVAAPYVAPPMAMPASVGPNTQPPGLPIPGVR